MPVPTLITDLSVTAASNSPAGGDSVFPQLDDYMRAQSAFIAQLNTNKAALAGATFTGTLTLTPSSGIPLIVNAPSAPSSFMSWTIAGTTRGYIGTDGGGIAGGGTGTAFGMRSEADLIFLAGGAERMRIDSSGNVGIGVAPAYKLDVLASSTILGRLQSTGASSLLFFRDAGTTGDSLYIGSNGNDWRVVTNNAERMRITSGGVIQDGAGNELGFKNVPHVAYTGASTLAIGDRGKTHYKSDSTQVTIPSGVFSAGDCVTILNWSASNMTIVQGAGLTMYRGGSGTTGNRTILGVGSATILFQAANGCVISGNIT